MKTTAQSYILVAIAVVIPLGEQLAGAGFIAPSGLPAGSQYEIAFVTADNTAATSTSIADYNSFVASEAAQDPSLPAGLTWHAIVSTVTTGAATNAPSLGSIPVFDTLGNRLTPAGQSLYQTTDATPMLTGIQYDQNGNLVTNNVIFNGAPPTPTPVVWTGSTDAGGIVSNGALGSNDPIITAAGGFGTNWLELSDLILANIAGASPHLTKSTPLELYALSSPITVAPEPASIVMAGTAIVGLIAICHGHRALT